MDLKSELIAILEKAKESNEYFNPHMLDGVISAIIDVYGDDSVSDELCRWASNMWSR